LKIAIDVTPITYSRGGVGYYTYKLVEAIIAIDKDDSFILYYGMKTDQRLPLFAGPNISIVQAPISPRIANKLFRQCQIPIEMFVGNVDIVHAPSYFVKCMKRTRSIITIHDLAYLIYPHTFPKHIIRDLEKHLKESIEHSSLILADSVSTKKDLIQYFKVDPLKVRVIYLGVDNKFMRYGIKDDESDLIESFGIERKYILHVGSFEPRKNIERLLQAYSLIRSNKQINHRLVLVGKDEWLEKDLFDEIRKTEYFGDVIILKDVKEDELIKLYNNAEMLVYPSLYEGFGLPLLEAMACGTPIAASYSSSIPEVVGEAAVYFDPLSVNEMAQKMFELIESEELRGKLIEAGLKRVAFFTWERTAQETINAYREVLN